MSASDDPAPAVAGVDLRRGRRPPRARARANEATSATAGVEPVVPPSPDSMIPPELELAFDGSVPAAEQVLWAAKTGDGRERALARLSAVRAWEADATAGSAEAIARGLEISRSRFYRMVSDWRSRPSLASLGAKAPAARARSTRTTLADAHSELQRALPQVVEAHARESVSAMVRHLRREVEGRVAKMPGDTMLRVMVERELRRLRVRREAGNEVVFDLCAIGLQRPGGLPHVMFACVDVATAFVLGVSVGVPEDSRAGYQAAAADALNRLGGGTAGLPWAPALTSAQITPGEDGAAWDDVVRSAGQAVGANVQAKGAGIRFGTDLRRLLGESLGRVRLVPFKTGGLVPLTISVAGAELTEAEARARVETGLVEHNAAVLAAAGPGSGTPPPGLLALLRLLAG